MTYKGKKVSRHRYRQLVKSRDNHRKVMDELFLSFHPSARQLKKIIEEQQGR